EPIVAIAAVSRAAADDAAALVDVQYEPLPAVLTPDAALAAGAPLIHPELGDNLLYETRLSAGDADRAFPALTGRGRARSRRAATPAFRSSHGASSPTTSPRRARSRSGSQRRFRT